MHGAVVMMMVEFIDVCALYRRRQKMYQTLIISEIQSS